MTQEELQAEKKRIGAREHWKDYEHICVLGVQGGGGEGRRWSEKEKQKPLAVRRKLETPRQRAHCHMWPASPMAPAHQRLSAMFPGCGHFAMRKSRPGFPGVLPLTSHDKDRLVRVWAPAAQPAEACGISPGSASREFFGMNVSSTLIIGNRSTWLLINGSGCVSLVHTGVKDWFMSSAHT